MLGSARECQGQMRQISSTAAAACSQVWGVSLPRPAARDLASVLGPAAGCCSGIKRSGQAAVASQQSSLDLQRRGDGLRQGQHFEGRPIRDSLHCGRARVCDPKVPAFDGDKGRRSSGGKKLGSAMKGSCSNHSNKRSCVARAHETSAAGAEGEVAGHCQIKKLGCFAVR